VRQHLWRAVVLFAALLGESRFLVAQARSDSLRYAAEQLDCATFLERAESVIQTESGGRSREQTSGRAGTWRFRAQPGVDGILLEGWLDSLGIWRKSSETAARPDTDGLVGGRYRGVLGSRGGYQSRTAPFIPDEVAELANMSAALDDFFPPLPSVQLRPGQAWKSSAGVTIRRMADSGMSGVPLYRFELIQRKVAKAAALPGDTTRIPLEQVSRERGNFTWHPLLGMIRRDRFIVVETTVPQSRRIHQAVRSRLEQRITLARDLRVPPASVRGCGGARS
jgi:hypothetical protein